MLRNEDLKQEKFIPFQFKGKRDYVHGTDMYREIIAVLADSGLTTPDGAFSMTIHKILRHQGRLIFTDWSQGALKPQDAQVEFTFVSGATRIIGWLTEGTEPVTGRYPYDEDSIVKNCKVHQKRIDLTGASPFSAIETIVAMNKYLHHAVLPGVPGKWFFTKIELNQLLPVLDNVKLYIELEQNLNNRVTKSQININGRLIGHIYFSLVKT